MKTIKFNVSHEDTCMENWLFEIEETDEGKVIRNSEIEFKRRGCQGHPKTIAALIKNRPINTIDTVILAETKCVRGKSCGMIFGECLSKIDK